MREGPSGSAFGDVGPFFSIINAKVRGEGFRRGNSTILTFVDTVVSHEAFTDRLLLRELVRVVQYEKLGLKEFAAKYVTGFLSGGSYEDRKSTRLNSSHGYISYAVFCLKKKKR